MYIVKVIGRLYSEVSVEQILKACVQHKCTPNEVRVVARSTKGEPNLELHAHNKESMSKMGALEAMCPATTNEVEEAFSTLE